jgi:hypothetical protein
MIENIRKEIKKQKELTNEELRTIFVQIIIFQKVDQKEKQKIL